jgi:hypothetical protein
MQQNRVPVRETGATPKLITRPRPGPPAAAPTLPTDCCSAPGTTTEPTTTATAWIAPATDASPSTGGREEDFLASRSRLGPHR